MGARAGDVLCCASSVAMVMVGTFTFRHYVHYVHYVGTSHYTWIGGSVDWCPLIARDGL